MPIQTPQWTDYLKCPVCCKEFGPSPRCPISLGCGHTLCRHCLKHLHKKQCPFDQIVIQSEPEELVVNTALLQLAGYPPPAQPHHPPCIQVLPEHDKEAYDAIVRGLEHLAVNLKLCGSENSGLSGNRLSRPMQKKFLALLFSSITDEKGRGRAARAARSLGERTVTELILLYQNPQQTSANIWAAVKDLGCQFLGPAMQEEVLKLILLALDDGSLLSRKVLVMFVVQQLEPHFPLASKTSIGHVVQLLYRASCFKVLKRERESSLMQLKDEFRTYESLRREHDAQIVQIALEAGLRISPDQWSSLLYGDNVHKSHMQSIIDKLQTPQSFAQSVQDLFIALHRTGDPALLLHMSIHLHHLAKIDVSPEQKGPALQELAEIIISTKEVVTGLIHFIQKAVSRNRNYNNNSPLEKCGEQSSKAPSITPQQFNKMPMCRISAIQAFCPKGDECHLLHFDEEFERIKAKESEREGNENAAAVQDPFVLAPQRPMSNQGMVGNTYGDAPPAGGAGMHLANSNPYMYVTQVPPGPGVSIGPAVGQCLTTMPIEAVPRLALPVQQPPQHMFLRYPAPPPPQHRLATVEGYNTQHMPPNVPAVVYQQPQNQRQIVNTNNDGVVQPFSTIMVEGTIMVASTIMVAGTVRMAVINPHYNNGITPSNVGGTCFPQADFLSPGCKTLHDSAYVAYENQQRNVQPAPLYLPNVNINRASGAPLSPHEPRAPLGPPAYKAYDFDDAQPSQYAIKYNVYPNEQPEGQNNWTVNNDIFNEPSTVAAADLRAEEFANRANEMFSDPPAMPLKDPRAD